MGICGHVRICGFCLFLSGFVLSVLLRFAFCCSSVKVYLYHLYYLLLCAVFEGLSETIWGHFGGFGTEGIKVCKRI